MRFEQLAHVTDGQVIGSFDNDRIFTGVSIDSRTVKAGELFVAVKGERVDGHDFIHEALLRGAKGLLVEKGKFEKCLNSNDSMIVEVDNSHKAMIKLAKAYLDSCHTKKIGISGSNGKTTTKEFISQLLSMVETEVYHSPGNYNNLYGIPLAIFAMPQETNVAVLEMGISTPGEMAQLSELVSPNLVVITNVSTTHLKFLGSIEAVVREKLSLTGNIGVDAPLVINKDDELLVREAKKVHTNIITFGLKNTADFNPDSVVIESDNETVVTIEGKGFTLKLFGQYQVYNLLAAYTAVRSLGYSFEGCDTLSLMLTTAPQRGQKIIIGGVTFIDDCYNANPDAIRRGLKSFEALLTKNRKVIILGSMLELGEESERFHRELGRKLNNFNFDMAVLVGDETGVTMEAAIDNGIEASKLCHYDDSESCAGDMLSYLQDGDLVYLKGSRSVHLEKVVARYKEGMGTC